MIGQEKLLGNIDRLTPHSFPRFSIIVGGGNCGKHLIAAYVAKQLDAIMVPCSTKVEDVREVINLSYKQSENTVYLLADADKMSIAAKNAILKVTEEPPRNAYFIMTLQDLSNTLDTLKSRGTVFQVNPYTKEELLEYAKRISDEPDYTQEELDIIGDTCVNPGDVNVLLKYKIQEFEDFVNTVLDNIGIVNGANAFKIGNKFKYKEEDEGWDITLTFRYLMKVCLERMKQSPEEKYLRCIEITSDYLSQLNIVGVHKPSTLDMWILEMRGALAE